MIKKIIDQLVFSLTFIKYKQIETNFEPSYLSIHVD